VRREGTFVADGSGQLVLSLPSLAEVFGAQLSNPAADPLPSDSNDPRLVDVDGDGYPGLSVGLKGAINGTVRSVQRQTTALAGVAVASDRVEGQMTYASEQVLIASEPAIIKNLYASSLSYTDPSICSSTFAMVRLPDAAPADCDWVRANEATLFGP
jgi:hypothetical protein